MISQLLNQYRPLSYLVLMQCTVVGFGTLATATMLKIWRGSVEGGLAVYNPVAIFVRDFGFSLLLVPAIWAGLVMYRIRRGRTEHLYVVSGVLLLILLFGFFTLTALRAVTFHLPIRVR